MILFKDKDGNVVGSIDGFKNYPPDLQMKVGDEVMERFDIPLGHPQEKLARRLMNPKDPLTIAHVRIKGDKVEEGSVQKPKPRHDKPETPLE